MVALLATYVWYMYVTGTHALLICTAAMWEAETMVITNGYDPKLCVGCVPIGTVTIPRLSLSTSG